MSRERIAELALLSYPAAARAARGEEMLATLHDVSADSRRGFAREIADLVRLGLRTRATATASVGARRLLADGLCLAAVWLMTLGRQHAARPRGPAACTTPCWPRRRSPCSRPRSRSRSSATTGSPAPRALLWTALRLPSLWDHHPGIVNLAPEVLPIVCFCVLVLAPRRRDRRPAAARRG